METAHTQRGAPLLEYVTYSTGRYGPKRAEGVTLQFVNVETGNPAYCVFNAQLTRKRNTQGGAKGDPLPVGQFRVGKSSKFYRFWRQTGLPLPNRPSKFYKHIGRLKSLTFTAELEGERIIKDTLRPATPTAPIGDSIGTRKGQSGDKEGTTERDKELTPAPASRDVPPFSTTGGPDCGTRSTGTRLYGEPPLPSPTPCPNCDGEGCKWCNGRKKRPQEQALEEWLADYGPVE